MNEETVQTQEAVEAKSEEQTVGAGIPTEHPPSQEAAAAVAKSKAKGRSRRQTKKAEAPKAEAAKEEAPAAEVKTDTPAIKVVSKDEAVLEMTPDIKMAYLVIDAVNKLDLADPEGGPGRQFVNGKHTRPVVARYIAEPEGQRKPGTLLAWKEWAGYFDAAISAVQAEAQEADAS